ncbi:hypothetical protein KI387_036215, partial [Taxus chinensis]
MKVECDVCERGEASVFCCADEAALCAACDSQVHQANKLASKHPRLSLLHSPPDFPTCDICQEKRAFFFCKQDRALLCRDCDFSVHSANDLTAKHSRFLVPGIKVSLHPSLPDALPPPPPSSSSSSNGKEEKEIETVLNNKEGEWVSQKMNPLTDLPIFPPKSAHVLNQGEPHKERNGGAGRADISQYLTEVEEFLASSSPARLDWFAIKGAGEDIGKALAADWAADVGLCVPPNFYRETMAEVPETETETEETCNYSHYS